VCCSINGIATCLRMSQGSGYVVRHGVHSGHAMLSGVAPTKVLCRKAPAVSRVSPSPLSRTRDRGSQRHCLPGKRRSGVFSAGEYPEKTPK
jgi:hypothetical protein